MTESKRTGRIATHGGHATLSFERRLPYPAEAVWAAITDPAQRGQWFGAPTLEARAGGAIQMEPQGPGVPDDLKRMTGRILVWDPPRIFEHEWKQRIIGDTAVRYELTPDGDATLLRFTHSLLAEKNAKGFIPGTHAYLDRLEAHLARAPIPDWWQRFNEVAPQYAAPSNG